MSSQSDFHSARTTPISAYIGGIFSKTFEEGFQVRTQPSLQQQCRDETLGANSLVVNVYLVSREHIFFA